MLNSSPPSLVTTHPLSIQVHPVACLPHPVRVSTPCSRKSQTLGLAPIGRVTTQCSHPTMPGSMAVTCETVASAFPSAEAVRSTAANSSSTWSISRESQSRLDTAASPTHLSACSSLVARMSHPAKPPRR